MWCVMSKQTNKQTNTQILNAPLLQKDTFEIFFRKPWTRFFFSYILKVLWLHFENMLSCKCLWDIFSFHMGHTHTQQGPIDPHQHYRRGNVWDALKRWEETNGRWIATWWTSELRGLHPRHSAAVGNPCPIWIYPS